MLGIRMASLLAGLALMTGFWLLTACQPVWAAEPVSTAFEDLDGDGFNDRAPDRNRDGIPDASRPQDLDKASSLSEDAGVATDIFAGKFDSPTDLSDLLPNSERFARLKLACRALCSNRAGLDSDFGPGEGIGVGAVFGAGGACSGGVCPL